MVFKILKTHFLSLECCMNANERFYNRLNSNKRVIHEVHYLSIKCRLRQWHQANQNKPYHKIVIVSSFFTGYDSAVTARRFPRESGGSRAYWYVFPLRTVDHGEIRSLINTVCLRFARIHSYFPVERKSNRFNTRRAATVERIIEVGAQTQPGGVVLRGADKLESLRPCYCVTFSGIITPAIVKYFGVDSTADSE